MTKFKGKYNNKRLKDLPNEQLRHIIAKSFQTGSMRDKKYMKALGDTPNLSQVKVINYVIFFVLCRYQIGCLLNVKYSNLLICVVCACIYLKIHIKI